MAIKSGGDDTAWDRHALEAPEVDGGGRIAWDSIWLHRRRGGVQQPRPIFTGDVFENIKVIGDDEGTSVVILQHPCALLDKKNEPREILLAARLIDHPEVTPHDWGGHYDIMPIVVLESAELKHQAVALDQLVLVRSANLSLGKRIACMEVDGITLLLQRWTNANTRVVVPSWRFGRVIDAQFAEAEGMEAWCAQRQRARIKPPQALKEATHWLDGRSEDTGRPRRDLLKDPSYRKGVIRRMHEVASNRTQLELEEKARQKEECATQPSVEVETEARPTEPAEASAKEQAVSGRDAYEEAEAENTGSNTEE